MQPTNFNLIDVVTVLQKRWKQIAVFVLLILIITTLLLYLMPKHYRSTAIVVAANPALADKARLFNNNIQGLYSNFGSGDDLDRIYGLANLDTTFKLLVDEFNLITYYKIKGQDIALNRRKAVLNLRDDIELQKTDISQLKIMVWSKNKQQSANIANRLVSTVQQMEEGIWKKNYETSFEKINASITEMEKQVIAISDTLKVMDITQVAAILMSNKKETLFQQIQQYQKTANDFKLAISNNAPALYIIENATSPAKHDKPKKVDVLIAALLTSIVFGCIITLVFDKRKNA